MAPMHTSSHSANPSKYFFSAMRRAEGSRPTLTAIRTFKTQPVRKEIKRAIQRDRETTPSLSQAEPGPSTPRQRERTPCSVAAGGESPLTSPSPSPPPISPIPTVVARARSPESATPAGSAAPPSSAQPPRPAIRLTRSASRSSIKSSSKVDKRSSAIETRLKPDGGIVTRFGEQDGEPIFIRQKRVTSTTEPDVVTYFWESFTTVPLRQPPTLTMYPDLTVGDLYCNHVKGEVKATQLWIWTMGSDGAGYWKRAREGDVREDGRRLTLTPKRKQPSWVSPSWGVKQLRNQKGR
ncbi:hypothetical protein C8T65DRAFT_744351 [Cerioporus squamosus]|nr:hypothetical protein C8T65DRAFT_744351 [Cerioporus squamosus]